MNMKEFEGMVYIGDIVDMDGDGWVDMKPRNNFENC